MQISVTTPSSPSSIPSSQGTGTSRTSGAVTRSTSGSIGGESHLNDAKWQVKYGFWNDLDVLYNDFPPLKKPRIPTQQLDGPQEWAKRMVPTSVESFLGNPTAIQCLHGLQGGDVNPLTNFIISVSDISATKLSICPALKALIECFVQILTEKGGECTGKLSFIGLLKHTLLVSGFDPPCTFGSVNAKHFGEKDLLMKIEDFVRRVDPHKVRAAFLVVERFEAVTPSTQQHFLLSILQDANAKSVFLILHVCPDVSKIAEQIKQRSIKVHLHQLKPMQVRTKLLHICRQEKIGFTRDGLEELLRRCDFKLLPSMERLRQVFLAQFFISLPNVQKKMKAQEINYTSQLQPPKPKPKSKNKSSPRQHRKPEVLPFPLSVLEMSEPLRRCKKCTLLPPCSHISLKTLFDKIQRIRNLYPHQDDDDDGDNNAADSEAGVISHPPPPEMCPSFLNTGVCSNIQSLGRCRYAHPLTLHKIDTSQIVKRCKVHTLPLPCTHCANVSVIKEELPAEIKLCMQLEAQLRACRKQFSELEMTKLLFVRDRAKSVKWGAQKREFDDKLANFEASLSSLRTEIDALGSELLVHQAQRDQLESDNERGTSHGTQSSSKARRA